MLLDRDSDHGRLVPTRKHSDPDLDPEHGSERLCCIQPQLHDDPDGSSPRPPQVYATCQGKITLVAKFKYALLREMIDLKSKRLTVVNVTWNQEKYKIY
jgi:hypothetical protein